MEWSYSGTTGPENWYKIYSAAAGSRQSPIDIKTNVPSGFSSKASQKLKWRYHPNDMFHITNTGHSWQVSAENNMSEISGGPLCCEYELAQVHAHWGSDDFEGSEHTINGKRYAGEVHLVHWNKTNYASFEEATKHPDGLCVLGVLLKLGDSHPELEKIVEKVPNILHKGDSTKLSSPLNPKSLLPKKINYWTYMGSLTTPPCLECVIWIVFTEPIEISHRQLEAFRSIRSHEADECKTEECGDQLLYNYRPTVPLGERVIVCSEP